MNESIKAAIRDAGVKQWQVAEKCGVSEFTFVRWLRRNLSKDREQAIYRAIDAAKGAKKE